MLQHSESTFYIFDPQYQFTDFIYWLIDFLSWGVLTGINKQIAVDAAYFPVVSSHDPRSVGLPQDPHGNSMLSCLSSGFLCPLCDSAAHSDAALPQPGSHHAWAGIWFPLVKIKWNGVALRMLKCLSRRGGVGDCQWAGGHTRCVHLGPLSSGWRPVGSSGQQSVQSCRVLSQWGRGDRQAFSPVTPKCNHNQHSLITLLIILDMLLHQSWIWCFHNLNTCTANVKKGSLNQIKYLA